MMNLIQEKKEPAKPHGKEACRCSSGIAGNERGIALILAIVMLMLLTIIGVMALSTTTSELHIAGNDRNNDVAFYTADAANDYGQVANSIYSSITSAPTSTTLLVSNQTATVTVQLVSEGPLPPGSGDDPELFHAYYYVVSTTGHGPNNAKVQIESQVARVVPK